MRKNFNDFYNEKKDILNKLFNQRENEIYNIRSNERKVISQNYTEYNNIFVAINNIPNGFTETKTNIQSSITKYLEKLNELQGIENEKFYKEGFSDAISLILNCCEKNKKIL